MLTISDPGCYGIIQVIDWDIIPMLSMDIPVSVRDRNNAVYAVHNEAYAVHNDRNDRFSSGGIDGLE